MDTFDHMTHRWFIRWWATICFFFGMSAVFIGYSAPNKPIDADVEVKVPGLVCPSCAIGIKNYLKKEINVKDIAFDVKKEICLIEFISIEIHPSQMRKIVKNAGYELKSIKWLKDKKPNRYNKP